MRIGLIGAGAVAKYHVAAAAALPGARLTAVCDLDETAAARAVQGVDGVRIHTDYRALVESPDVDAVIVNTPHSLHLPMTVDAVRAGKHVLVEKPMATSLEDCDRMVQESRDAGVGLTIGHIQHFLPDKIAARDVLATGDLGEVMMIRDHRSTDYRPGARPEWFFSRSIAGGGALLNIGGHCLDRSLWFGGSRAVEVSASVARRFGVPVETDGTIALRLANGVGVTIAVISDPPSRSDSLAIVCERGVIETDPRLGTVVRRDGQTSRVREPQPDDIQRAFTAQLADFLGVIDGEPPAVPLEHARHVVELVLASYESAVAQRSHQLPLLSPVTA
ncbi:Gfo/Idh/MocA family protein [Microbacterium aurugineum]|uniref:Gfo/Idh/MocA family protein n=1 Tax=Microbacterium aurugineum TaxID=2851642 RepID=UPI0020BF2EB1|nr:Gfo/Idh/MocA family oxidoreductase [Microbacterium aurugineum]MCK8478342.1 Gfo/Idh/MocA family oxidoreductase [Microbacterium aurugineum]